MRSDGILYGDQTERRHHQRRHADGDRSDQRTEYTIGKDNIAAAPNPLPAPMPNPPTFPNNTVTTGFNAIGAIAFEDIGLRTRFIGTPDQEHYAMFYSVTDDLGISHLFEADPSDGNAIGGKTSIWNPIALNSEGVFGPFDGTLYENAANVQTDINGYVTSVDVGTVTGMSFVSRQGDVLVVPAANTIQLGNQTSSTLPKQSGQTFSISDISRTITFQFELNGQNATIAGAVAYPSSRDGRFVAGRGGHQGGPAERVSDLDYWVPNRHPLWHRGPDGSITDQRLRRIGRKLTPADHSFRQLERDRGRPHAG